MIQEVQEAIDYMEDHLMTVKNYEEVAAHLNISCYHFHRIFSMLTGISPNEYIRNRRLSLAGQEVILSNKKIIDIAYDFHYQTPESFSKAFSRFHGVPPKRAREIGGHLKMFNRLTITVIAKGGVKMDYRIEKNQAFKAVVKAKTFDNEIINQEGNNDIPNFWKHESEAGIFDRLAPHSSSRDVYGFCGPIDQKSNSFKYAIGMKTDKAEVDDEFTLWDVAADTWAVFKCIGQTPDCIGQVWDHIFKEFLPGSKYKLLDAIDFEKYSDDFENNVFCEIWIPIALK
jgi:AraC family transcriptional regulator